MVVVTFFLAAAPSFEAFADDSFAALAAFLLPIPRNENTGGTIGTPGEVARTLNALAERQLGGSAHGGEPV